MAEQSALCQGNQLLSPIVEKTYESASSKQIDFGVQGFQEARARRNKYDFVLELVFRSFA
jgi:hypothetical protein